MLSMNLALWAREYTAGTSSLSFQDLYGLADRGGVGRSRICLHNKPEDPGQCMIIFVRANVCFPVHRHLAGDESYFLISGQIVLLTLNDELQLRERTVLTSVCGEDKEVSPNHLSQVKKRCWHTLYAESDSLYVEFRDSPFLPNLEEDLVHTGRTRRQLEVHELRALAIGESILNFSDAVERNSESETE